MAVPDHALSGRDRGTSRKKPVPVCRCSSIRPATICYTAQNRRAAVKDRPQCDVGVIVVGSENSSNSAVRLARWRRRPARSYRIDGDAGRLQPEWLRAPRSVGVTSGASVPESLVEQLLDALEELGFDERSELIEDGGEPSDLRSSAGTASRHQGRVRPVISAVQDPAPHDDVSAAAPVPRRSTVR